MTVSKLASTSTLTLDQTLSLLPRLRLHVTVRRADLSLSPLDHWRLRSSLSSFLRRFSAVPESDIVLLRRQRKRSRDEAEVVAEGEVFVRDLGFAERLMRAEDESEGRERRFREWREKVVTEMDGMEINLQGVKFRLGVSSPVSDDFEKMKKEWEEYYAFQTRGYSRSIDEGLMSQSMREKEKLIVIVDRSMCEQLGNSRGGKQQPDTLVLRGVPSRWFAETRVSSKPSMLVTHTILSAFGKIRNLSVAEDDDFSKNDDEDNLVSGLHCKIVVQYDKYSDFEAAMKGLCGRSLQKQGSHLKADYEVTWEKDGFKNAKSNEILDRSTRTTPLGRGSYRSDAPRRQSDFSRYSPDNVRAKRFRD